MVPVMSLWIPILIAAVLAASLSFRQPPQCRQLVRSAPGGAPFSIRSRILGTYIVL